jgi:predicted Zn-dependent protease
MSPTPAADALEILSRAVAASPADETAFTWIERRRVAAGTRGGARPERVEHELLVRVLEAGRPGAFRPAGTAPHELAEAIRHAMAAARGSVRLPEPLTLTPPAAHSPVSPELYDRTLAALDGEAAHRLLREHVTRGESARLECCELALTVVTSRGLVRQVQATSVELEVRAPRRPGAGSAAAAARTLARLAPAEVFARAWHRDAGEAAAVEGVEALGTPSAIVLAPEAAASLVAVLGRELLAAAAWTEGRGFPALHRGGRVMAAELTLTEDPTAADGLPLPWSRTGAAAEASALVRAGILVGPVADAVWAAQLGVPVTIPVWLGEAPRAEHLTLAAGGLDDAGLLAAAGDGALHVCELEGVEVWDRGTLAARLRLVGVRRVEGGALGTALPDLTWDVPLPLALSAVRGVGRDRVSREEPGALGGVTAPGLALAAAGTFLPRPG